jgi:hypothetical protein
MIKQTNASRPLDQAGWMPRHVVREACRAEFRAWCRAARKPSWLATATAAAMAVGSIAATGATAPQAAAATSPAASAHAWTGEAEARPLDLALWLRQPPRPAASAATKPTLPVSPVFWADPAVRDPYGRLSAARPAKPSARGVARHVRTAGALGSHAAMNVPLRFAVAGHAPGATAPHAGVANRAARHALKPKAAPSARPYQIYDSVTPTAIPAGRNVATYADGPYAASPSAVAGRGRVLWIDVNGTDLRADALDVEPATPRPRLPQPGPPPSSRGTRAPLRSSTPTAPGGRQSPPTSTRCHRGCAPASGTGSPTPPATRTSSRVPARPSGTGGRATTSPPRSQGSGGDRHVRRRTAHHRGSPLRTRRGIPPHLLPLA